MADDKIVHIDFAARHNQQKEKQQEEEKRIYPHQHVFDSSNNFKLETFEDFLNDGTVRVTLDPTKPNVTLPKFLMDRQFVVLTFDYRYNIDDFYFDQYCVRATLSFDTEELWCDVPWVSVVCIANEQTGEAFHFKSVDSDPDPS